MYSKDLWSEPDKHGYVDRLLDKGLGIHTTDPDRDYNSTVGWGDLRSSLQQLSDTLHGVDYDSDISVEEKSPQSNSNIKEFRDSSRYLWDNIVTQRPSPYILLNTTARDEEPPQQTSFVENISYENPDKLTHLNWFVRSNAPNEYQFLELILPGIDTFNITVSSTRNTINIKIIPALFGSQCITKSKLNLHTPSDITINLIDNIAVDRVEHNNGELRIRLISLIKNSSVVYHTILE